jgi:hypothetical protein
MATLRITEAELGRDVNGVLTKVSQGVDGIVEQDHPPVAVIHSPHFKVRLLSECIAHAEARASTVTLDEGFMKDVEDGHREPQPAMETATWE